MRIQKKKTPWGAFAALLLLLCLLAYFFGGLCKLPDVTLLNYEEKLTYIFRHPLENWWTDRTVGFLGFACIGWLMMVSYYMDKCRNTHFGAENGTAQWADTRRLGKTLRNKEETKNTYLSQNIAVSNEKLSNQNLLIIGGSGSFKTTSVVTPNLLVAGMTNVVLDIKGELLRKHGNYLKKHGITVKSLNLINPEESDRYNPFAYVEKETDIIRLITNIQRAATPPDAHKGDPFWDEGVALYAQALFFQEWLAAKEEKRPAVLSNVLRLINMESRQVDEEGTTALQQEMNRLADRKGDEYPPVRDYRKLKDGAPETVKSIVLMVNAMFRLCEVASLKRIFEADDLDIKSLGLGVEGNPEKKTALFLVMPDNDPSFNFIINIFYTQMFDVLCRTADFECGGALPIHVRLWADEFYAGPKPNNPETLLGTIRGRNMSMVPVLQSIAQIEALFPQKKWEIFTGNCAAAIYLGSGRMDYSTHKYIADLLGEMTIDTRNDSHSTGMHGNHTEQNGRGGRGLMTPEEVGRMPRKECIIFLEGQYPIYDQKALPFRTKRWLESEALAFPRGYRHPVRVVYNPEMMTYKTITTKKNIQFLDKQEVRFYKQAAQTDASIHVFELEEKEFLYLNFRKQPPLTDGELEEIFRSAREEQEAVSGSTPEKGETELPEDIRMLRERQEAEPAAHREQTVPESGTSKAEWNLSGSIFACIKRHAGRLTEEQLNEILGGLEDGLTEKQVKSYFTLPAEKMNQYRRAYLFQMRKE